jgi:hypothetical protein
MANHDNMFIRIELLVGAGWDVAMGMVLAAVEVGFLQLPRFADIQ